MLPWEVERILEKRFGLSVNRREFKMVPTSAEGTPVGEHDGWWIEIEGSYDTVRYGELDYFLVPSEEAMPSFLELEFYDGDAYTAGYARLHVKRDVVKRLAERGAMRIREGKEDFALVLLYDRCCPKAWAAIWIVDLRRKKVGVVYVGRLHSFPEF